MYGLAIAGVLRLHPLGLAPANLGNPGLACGLTLPVSLAMLLAWCLYFDADKVRRIGFVYVERLFEYLSSLPGDMTKKGATRAPRPRWMPRGRARTCDSAWSNAISAHLLVACHKSNYVLHDSAYDER